MKNDFRKSREESERRLATGEKDDGGVRVVLCFGRLLWKKGTLSDGGREGGDKDNVVSLQRRERNPAKVVNV